MNIITTPDAIASAWLGWVWETSPTTPNLVFSFVPHGRPSATVKIKNPFGQPPEAWDKARAEIIAEIKRLNGSSDAASKWGGLTAGPAGPSRPGRTQDPEP